MQVRVLHPLAIAILIALAGPCPVAHADEEPSFAWFEWLHRGHTAAELVCKYWYGDVRPAETDSAEKWACYDIRHPLEFAQDHEPQWWLDLEPPNLRAFEDRMKERRAAGDRLARCKEQPLGCYKPFAPHDMQGWLDNESQSFRELEDALKERRDPGSPGSPHSPLTSLDPWTKAMRGSQAPSSACRFEFLGDRADAPAYPGGAALIGRQSCDPTTVGK
jgi:hypothetical protein